MSHCDLSPVFSPGREGVYFGAGEGFGFGEGGGFGFGFGFRAGDGYGDGRVIGKINNSIIEDNTKRWSGDHCIDPGEVPGLMLTNRRHKCEKPKIIDIAPSVLQLLGVTPPKFIDGQPIIPDMES